MNYGVNLSRSFLVVASASVSYVNFVKYTVGSISLSKALRVLKIKRSASLLAMLWSVIVVS